MAANGSSSRGSSPARAAHEAQAAFASAARLEADGQAPCVDFYYLAATRAWHVVELASAEGAMPSEVAGAWITYQLSLQRLIATGQQYDRLDPASRLVVYTPSGLVNVPTAYHGFTWQPRDFNYLLAASEFRDHELAHHYFSPGLGTALVAVRATESEEAFFRLRHPFAATAVLRPADVEWESGVTVSAADGALDGGFLLEFYNPHVFDHVPVGRTNVALERDLTAPLAFAFRDSPRTFWEGFLSPADVAVQPKLLMTEPYARGKIPVVFIHGLLSDARDWSDLANELRAQPDLQQNFQFWAYRYPTGGDIMKSVADLRDLLRLARDSSDAQHEDPALDRMVLVGHSLGGLVSKCQIAQSQDILWRHVARAPPELVRAPPRQQAQLHRLLFFEPAPSVSRVIFIGTPHRGSAMAQRLIGRVSTSLVRFGAAEDREYQALIAANRDIFYPYLWKSRPTSIDLLEPDSPILAALDQMPLNPAVRMHSIIGTGGALSVEPSDGVVPVASARQRGVESELYVPAKHSALRSDPAVVREVMRILREHAATNAPSSCAMGGQ